MHHVHVFAIFAKLHATCLKTPFFMKHVHICAPVGKPILENGKMQICVKGFLSFHWNEVVLFYRYFTAF